MSPLYLLDLMDDLVGIHDVTGIRNKCTLVLIDYTEIHAEWVRKDIGAWRESYKRRQGNYPSIELFQQRADNAIQVVDDLKRTESYPLIGEALVGEKIKELLSRLKVYRDSIPMDFPSSDKP